MLAVMMGFTRNEQKVLLFLTIGFFSGLVLKLYNQQAQPLPVATESAFNPGQASIDGSDFKTTALLAVRREKVLQSNVIALNTATEADLERIPGIGPVMARRIIDYRGKHGRFQSVPDILKVKGIGRKTFIKIKPYLIID
jgi:competence protein ComEA